MVSVVRSADGLPAARFDNSRAYANKARQLIPRGVASAQRASVKPTPLTFVSAVGSRLTDVDGNTYVDYVCAFGPAILGHNHPAVVGRVQEQLRLGTLFGGQHEGELALAERVIDLVPSADQIAFANSGSEAVHTALRIARASTGRRCIIKFHGHYHGWISPVLSGGPIATDDVTDPGPPLSPAPDNEVLLCPWDDEASLSRLFAAHGETIAAVIMEPIPCNAGTFLPHPRYLDHARSLCDEHGVLLIFDEVLTGFRVGAGGAQEALGTHPDLTVLAKALGGGFPIAAVAGTDSAMSVAANSLKLLGTYNGHAIGTAAAVATLDEITKTGNRVYETLEASGEYLANSLVRAADETGAPLTVNRVGSILQLFWGLAEPARTYAEVCNSDAAGLASFSEALLRRGVYLLPRGLLFVSTAHSAEDLELTGRAIQGALREVLS